MTTLIIDNFDSFTYNLSDLFARVEGRAPSVFRNCDLSLQAIIDMSPSRVVLSPGPGHPENARDFGVCRDLIASGTLPLLGVCLGHQGLGSVLGGNVCRAAVPMHGRTSAIHHDAEGLFRGLPDPFTAVRYHSLLLEPPLPASLMATAWSDDEVIMAIAHRSLPMWGVQFHPESIASDCGRQLIENFIALSTGRRPIVVSSRPAATEAIRELGVHSRCMATAPNAEDVFVALYADQQTAFWLDSASVVPGGARYSFMGDVSGPNAILSSYDLDSRTLTERTAAAQTRRVGDLFALLDDDLRALSVRGERPPLPFIGGWIGYFGYELKALTGAAGNGAGEQPDAALLFVDRFIAIDHVDGKLWMVALARPGEEAATDAWFSKTERALRAVSTAPPLLARRRMPPVRFEERLDPDAYLAGIHAAQRAIRDGESYEVCLTNRISTCERLDTVSLYRRLRKVNPAPYAALFRCPWVNILSSSPERFLKIDADGFCSAKPIKGTVPRSPDAAADQALARGLSESVKDRAENLMIVDLLRNDLSRVCKAGSVAVEKLMAIETFATVHQMVSTITGRLVPEASPLAAIAAAFPGGSMTGAPKLRTMEIIDALEGLPRGPYAGSLGYIGVDGAVDLNIVIRTWVQVGDTLWTGCGGAITILSDPDAEHAEMRLKAVAPIRALAEQATGDPDNWCIEPQGQSECETVATTLAPVR
jgi:para-aminobenzoate synthetase